jgi:hypothetical protein
MKMIALGIVATGLIGCAGTHSTQRITYSPQAMTLSQLESIKVSQRDCSRINDIVTDVETQLKIRGTFGRNPEELGEADRKYNSTGKVVIWSLRIGCNNPDRYN